MQNVVAYTRVSTANQVENGEGLEIQRDRILSYCKERGIKVWRFYEDKGISGAIKDRPGLLSLLKDCEKGTVKSVVFYKQDRLSRDLTVSLWLETQFKKHDIELLSVVDPEYDMEDPLQKAFKRISDIFAELEKDVIATRLKEGRMNNAKNGKRSCGSIPYGFVKKDGALEIDPDEARHVVRIFKWAIKGHRYSEIVRRLNKRGATSKRNKQFTPQALKYILTNKMYYGETSFGDFNILGVHSPIISKRLYVKVQRVLHDNYKAVIKDF